jgi:hydrogenase maturation protease
MNEWEWHVLEDKKPVFDLRINGTYVQPGSRVRLQPRPGGDIMDLALTGKTAVIEAIEQDYEGKVHVCVVVDDDPGRDIGMMRQPGHRFFFDADEVEPLGSEFDASVETSRPRILIAGIGNIFLGDDAFGVEVARRLAERQLPAEVKVTDFGIRGYDLAYALLDGYETTILVDACPRGEVAGTLYVIEPEVNEPDTASVGEHSPADAHSMNPLNVLRLAQSMGGPLKKVLLVGCEPATLGPEEGQMGLSPQVEAAVGEAVKLVESLVSKILSGDESLIGNWETKSK